MKTGALTSRYYVRGTSTDVRLTLRRPTLPLISRRASCVLLITPLSRRGLQEEHSAVCKRWFLIQSIVESPWIIFFVGLQGASEKFKIAVFWKCLNILLRNSSQPPCIRVHIDGWQHKGAMSRKPVFEKIVKHKGRSMWKYDICSADTGTCYDYYWQHHDIF